VKTVLLFSGATIYGGAERSLLLLAGALPGHGWRPVLACPPGRLADEARSQGIEVENLDVVAGRTLETGRREGRAALVAAQVGMVREWGEQTWRVTRLVRRVRPDLVHSNSLGSHIPVALSARVTRVPTVLHLREIIKPGPGRRAFDLFSGSARALIAISASTAGAVGHRRTVVIHNPVALPPVDVEATDWGRPRPLVGFVGRLDEGKGLEDLIEAMGEVPAHLVVVGAAWAGSEEYVASLRALAERLAPGRVHFVGEAGSPWPAMAGMDVLAVPSHLEPFGRVAVEGQLSGLPVVAAEAGGLVEIVTDDVDGLLHPVRDVEALAQALNRLLGDPALRERLGKAGAESGRRFSSTAHAAAVTALYADVVGA
jgi:glycosyltransferase involved in cell wall biosynthesis